MKKYKVTGIFEGKKISEIVNANSKKQAKLKAGFKSGFGGFKMSSFIKSRSVRARLVK